MHSLKMGVACALVLEAAACGSSPLVPTHDAGRDVVTPHDAIVADHGVDAVADAKEEARPIDAAPVCFQTLAPCTSDAGGSCGQTWAEVLARPPYCLLWIEFRGTCGPYNVDDILNGDEETIYYYDGSTGQLAAIYVASMNTVVNGVEMQRCATGPPEGILTCAGPPLDDVCRQDAGADASD
jgi:hypothetical protein